MQTTDSAFQSNEFHRRKMTKIRLPIRTFREWKIRGLLSTTPRRKPQKMNINHQINVHIFPRQSKIHTSTTVLKGVRGWWNNLLRVSRATNVQAFKKRIAQPCSLEIAIVAWCVTRAPSLDICTCTPGPWIPCVCVCASNAAVHRRRGLSCSCWISQLLLFLLLHWLEAYSADILCEWNSHANHWNSGQKWNEEK